MDLDKLSNQLETALEQAREFAESRRHASITPEHLLTVLCEPGSDLVPLLEQAGLDSGRLLQIFADALARAQNVPKLEPGQRAKASPSLRVLIEKSFHEMEIRGADRAHPVDLLMAAMDSLEDAIRRDLRAA